MKPILDVSTLDNFSPYEAQAMLDKLREIYKDGVSVPEAVELHRLQKVLKAKAESTL
jgi:hypothetical protein